MAHPTLRDLAAVILRDLLRPTHAKLVALVILFVGSFVAEQMGYLASGRPGATGFEGQTPLTIIIFALLVGVVAQGARMDMFSPVSFALLALLVLGSVAMGGCNVAAGLWGITEDVFGPFGVNLQQTEFTDGREEALRQAHSDLVQRLKCG